MLHSRFYRSALFLVTLALLAGCTSTAPAGYSSLVLALHPTAYWKLDSAALTINDSSGHGNDGTLSQAAGQVPGPLHGIGAKALHFDGPQSIAITHPIGLGPSTSLELWVNYSSTTPVHILRSNGTNSSGDYHFVEVFLALPTSSTNHVFSVYDFLPSGAASASATSPISANVWHYLVLTNDGTTDILYQDGVQVGAGPSAKAILTPSILPTNPAIEIGSGTGKSLANIAIYPLVLTPAQVQSHWQAGCGC